MAKRSFYHYPLSSFVIFLFLIAGLAIAPRPSFSLAVDKPGVNDLGVIGYVWSSNTGWISFCSGTSNITHCPGGSGSASYQTYINNETGALAGHAWSSNVGWLSFNREETGDLPPQLTDECGGTQGNPLGCVDFTSHFGKGWARFLSACDPNPTTGRCTTPGAGANSGGWDGWVKLGGTAADGNDYHLETRVDRLPGGDKWVIPGWVWGSEVFGWGKSSTTQSEALWVQDRPKIDAELSAKPRIGFPGQPIVLTATATTSNLNALYFDFYCQAPANSSPIPPPTKTVIVPKGSLQPKPPDQYTAQAQYSCIYVSPKRYQPILLVRQDSVFGPYGPFTLSNPVELSNDPIIGPNIVINPADVHEIRPEKLPPHPNFQ